MHISHHSDDELQKSLTALLNIITSYQHHYFYNGALVNPYLLASHGLAITRKRQIAVDKQTISFSAACSDSHCNLSITLDGHHHELEPKEELESVIRDHDSECSYYKVKDNLICFKLFVRLGKWIFQEGLAALQAQNAWIQLNPTQISDICSKGNKNQRQQDSYGSIWSQIKQLDSSISEQSFTKVKSNILLAIFGWKWTSRTLLTCRFCGSTRDVSQFISPLQFSLLKVSEGFSFVGEHQSWCCLVTPSECFWQEILRQAVVGRLKAIQGTASKNLLELQCRNIQRNLLQILSEQLPRMNTLRRQIEQKKSSVQARLAESEEKQGQREEGQLQQKQQAQKCLLMHFSRLCQILQEQRKNEQDLILRIQGS